MLLKVSINWWLLVEEKSSFHLPLYGNQLWTCTTPHLMPLFSTSVWLSLHTLDFSFVAFIYIELLEHFCSSIFFYYFKKQVKFGTLSFDSLMCTDWFMHCHFFNTIQKSELNTYKINEFGSSFMSLSLYRVDPTKNLMTLG